MKNEIIYEQLSVREQVVLQLAAHGYSNEEIARKLQNTSSTIRTQLRSVYLKLRARNRAHATLIAAHCQIIDYDETLLL